MTTASIDICPADALVDGGLAYKVPVRHGADLSTAFFVRYEGKAYGYLNRCPHMGSELDWENNVFTRAGDLLMCARHGATFQPDTGQCTGGPCVPSKLIGLKVSEELGPKGETVVWWPEGKIGPV